MQTDSPSDSKRLQLEARALKGHKSLVSALSGPVLGALVGLGYYYTVGCATGTCALTSTWWTSMLYGGLMGQLVKTSWSS